MIFKCEECGKEIERQSWELKKAKHHYCSPQCRITARRKGIIIKCDWCGKELERKPSKLKRSKHFFCTREHYSLGRLQINISGPKRTYDRICIRCGTNFKAVLNEDKQSLCQSCVRLLGKVVWDKKRKDDPTYKETQREYNRRRRANTPLHKFVCEYCKKPGKARISNARFHQECAPKARAKTLVILTRNQREEIARLRKQIEQLQIEVNTAKEWWDYYEQRSNLKEETIQRLTFVLERASEHASKHKLRANGK